MKKLAILICFIIMTFGISILSAQEPPPPQPPYSEMYPESTYTMTQEQIIGGFALRLWEDPSADEFMFSNIATLQWDDGFGGGFIQVEMVAEIDSLTGTDINTDGFPDIIIKTYSGGAHCCSSAHVYSLQPQNPIKIYEGRESNCPINFADVDMNGVYEILTCDDSFAYLYCPYASSYAQQVILKYDPSWMTYIPATAELIGVMSDFHFQVDISTAQSAVDGAYGEWDGTTKCQMLPAVIGYLYTNQPNLAWQTLNTYYTAPDIAEFRAQIEAIVFSSPLYQAIVPPVSSTIQPPLFIDAQVLIDNYVARIWKSGSYQISPHETIGQLIRLSDNTIIAEINNVSEFPMNSATDINNNAIPDIIINTFTGGAHCCSSTIAYDLGATPTLILQTRESNYGGRFEDIDGNGTEEFLTADDIFAYAYCPYVASPAPQVILSYDGAVGFYVPVNQFYPERYAEAIAQSTAYAETAPDGEMGEFDGTNKCAVLPVVLNYLYSGQYDMAWAEFYRLYRGGDADAFRAEIEATVNSSCYYMP